MKGQCDNTDCLASLKPEVSGFGYAGLPLALEIAKKLDVTGFDTNRKRVHELRNCIDVTKEAKAYAMFLEWIKQERGQRSPKYNNRIGNTV